MSRTVLLSEVNEVAGRFPEGIASIYEVLERAGIPRCGEGTVPLVAEQIVVNPEVREDLLATCLEVYRSKPEMTQLEMLSVLVVAAAEPDDAGQLAETTEMDQALRGLFSFVLESRRRQSEDLPERSENQPVPRELRPEPATPRAEEQRATLPEEDDMVSRNAIAHEQHFEMPTAPGHLGMLARALERAAVEGSSETVATGETRHTEEHGSAEEEPNLQARQRSQAALPARHAVLAEEEEDLGEEDERAPRRWGLGTAATCGVLLGFGLGVFLHFDRGAARGGTAIGGSNTRQQVGTTAGWGKSVDQLQAEIAAMDSVANMSPAMEERNEGHRTTRPLRNEAPPKIASPVAAVRSHATVTPMRPDATMSVRRSGSVVQPPPDTGVKNSVARSVAASGTGPSNAVAVRAVSLNEASLPTDSVVHGPALPRVTTGSAGIMAANLLSSPAPAYPIAASAAGVQGEVVVEAVVGRDGEVVGTRIVSGPLLLRAAALDAVQHWHYRPYEVDGKPIEIATTARLEFRLAQ